MKQNNYHSSIAAHVSSQLAFANIADVSGWWAKNFEGKAMKNGDTFKVTFGKTWVDFEIEDATPGKKIVWKVKDCNLDWINDKKEWNDTKVVWELSENNGTTRVDMTHVGLVPGVECYKDCEAGWNEHVKDSLLNVLKGKVGNPV